MSLAAKLESLKNDHVVHNLLNNRLVIDILHLLVHGKEEKTDESADAESPAEILLKDGAVLAHDEIVVPAEHELAGVAAHEAESSAVVHAAEEAAPELAGIVADALGAKADAGQPAENAEPAGTAASGKEDRPADAQSAENEIAAAAATLATIL